MTDAIIAFLFDQALPVAILGLFVIFLILQLKAKDKTIDGLHKGVYRAIELQSVQNETSRQATEAFSEVSRRLELLERAISRSG